MNDQNSEILVAVVDDDANIRHGLWWLLNNIVGLRCTGAFSSVSEAFDTMRQEPPDILLLDVSLPGRSGLEAVRPLQRAYPDLKIVMHSNYDDHDKILRAIEAGAFGYVLKNVSAPQLFDAIRHVHAGKAVWPPGYPPRKRRSRSFRLLQRLRAWLRTSMVSPDSR